MITYKDKSYNSWNDIAKDYPAMWVVFDKVDFRKGRVWSGNVWEILPDNKIIDFENRNRGRYVLSLRTTETVNIADEAGATVGGYIHGELVDA